MSNPTLKNPPLVLTLAQVKFNSVPTMDSYYKEIQNEFRKQLAFIKHDIEESASIRITQQGSDIKTSTLWTSATPNAKTRLILGNDYLAIETNEYPGFGKFIPNFYKALQIVQAITEVTHVTRIGFRYINRIETTPEKNLEYYLSSQLQGFKFESIEHDFSVSRTEALANTKQGRLRVHCVQFLSEKDASKSPLLPPDIGTQLFIRPVLTPAHCKYAYLDIDHFKQYENEPIRFELPAISKHLDLLHQGGYAAFMSGVTPKAIKEWQ